jgi:hypothetical protein
VGQGGTGGSKGGGVGDSPAPIANTSGGGSDSDGADSLGSAGGNYKAGPGAKPGTGGAAGGGGSRVFTNWGGDFFKKNLDYRANTNKILEKMNLVTGGSGSGASSSSGSVSPAAAISSAGGGLQPRPRDLNGSPLPGLSSSLGNFVPGERFKVRMTAYHEIRCRLFGGILLVSKYFSLSLSLPLKGSIGRIGVEATIEWKCQRRRRSA